VGKARLILRGQDDVGEAFAWSAQAAQLVDDVGLEPDVDVALGAALALVERQGCGGGVEGGGSDGDAGHGKRLTPRPR
jgi:hypothetical protein